MMEPPIYFLPTSKGPQSSKQVSNVCNVLCFLNDDRKLRKFVDFELVSGTVHFPCHRIILAGRSSVMKKLLFASCSGIVSEHSLNTEIDDVIGETLMNFLYTFDVKLTETNILKLMEVAKELELQDLLNVCDQFCAVIPITDINFFELFRWSSQWNLGFLRERLRPYMGSNFSSLVKNEKILELDGEELAFVLESDSLQIEDEREALHLIERWAEHCEDRLACLPDLLYCVRLAWIDFSYKEFQRWLLFNVASSAEAQMLFHRAFEFRHFPASRWALQCEMTRPRLSSDFREVLAIVTPQQLFIGYLDGSNLRYKLVTSFPPKSVLAAKGPFPQVDFSARPVLYDDKLFLCYKDESAMFVMALDGQIEKEAICCSKRTGAGSVAVGQHIYLIGGSENGKVLASVHCFSTAIKEWKQMPDLVEPVFSPCVFSIDEKIYVIGHQSRSLQIFSLDEKKWTLLENALPMNVYGSTAVCFDSQVYVLGQNRLATLDLVTFDMKEVVRLEFLSGLLLSTCITIFNGKLYVISKSKIVPINIRHHTIESPLEPPCIWQSTDFQFISMIIPKKELDLLIAENPTSLTF